MNRNTTRLVSIALSTLFTAMPIFAGASPLCASLFGRSEIIEGEIISSTELVPLRNGSDLKTRGQENYLEFMRFQRELYYQVTNQKGIFVNQNKVQTSNVDLADFKLLRQFHSIDGVGLNGSKDHRVMIKGRLSYVGSEAKMDEKGKPIKIHKYLQVASEKLKIYGILVEEITPQGSRFNRFHIRFSNEDAKASRNMDIPLMYTSFAAFQEVGRNNHVKDAGYQLNFSGGLKITNEKAKARSSGVQATLKLSGQKATPKDLLEVSLYITK